MDTPQISIPVIRGILHPDCQLLPFSLEKLGKGACFSIFLFYFPCLVALWAFKSFLKLKKIQNISVTHQKWACDPLVHPNPQFDKHKLESKQLESGSEQTYQRYELLGCGGCVSTRGERQVCARNQLPG